MAPFLSYCLFGIWFLKAVMFVFSLLFLELFFPYALERVGGGVLGLVDHKEALHGADVAGGGQFEGDELVVFGHIAHDNLEDEVLGPGGMVAFHDLFELRDVLLEVQQGFLAVVLDLDVGPAHQVAVDELSV